MNLKIFLKFCTIALISLIVTFPAFSSGESLQIKYIRKYHRLAVREMYRSGVPASITLAQGLLESNCGLSELVKKGNNHFGIKCHNWTGKTMTHDDDRKNECFRVYNSAEDSYRDHSDFLRFQDRYKPLFENSITDYKSWAFGLKKAGYATDPSYPSKLINLIETYKLYEYDRMTGDEKDPVYEETIEKDTESISENKKQSIKQARKKRHRKNRRKEKMSIPQTPLSLETPKKYSSLNADETFNFSLSRQLYSQNGVPFIYSVEGETLSSIAADNELFLREILKYNDMDKDVELSPGTIVYLRPKKNKAAKGIDKYIIDHDGESLWEISQRFGVKLKSIYKMNKMGTGYVPKEGDTIILR